MPDFHEELERRTEQFRYYLELMRQRRGAITEGNCFIIFEERLLSGDTGSEQLTKATAPVYQSTAAVSGWDAPADLDETFLIDLPDDGSRADDSSFRFIQFSFNPRYFDSDIPNTTQFRAEAEIILRRRSGFFYLTENRQWEHPGEKADEFNPMRKIYLHGDERSAAEDMAYLFFNVWKFPVDWRFYVTAAAWHDKTKWENGLPIE